MILEVDSFGPSFWRNADDLLPKLPNLDNSLPILELAGKCMHMHRFPNNLETVTSRAGGRRRVLRSGLAVTQ